MLAHCYTQEKDSRDPNPSVVMDSRTALALAQTQTQRQVRDCIILRPLHNISHIGRAMRDEQRLYSVHFLRFFASASVVVHHVIARYEPKLIVGAAGVDMFFIISGLVIGLAGGVPNFV